MEQREFRGTGRFLIKSRLGRGGMGAVYHVFDRERGMDLALKTLVRLEPAAIYRFKREFRALSNVSHPNLVALYEMVSLEDQWFFTMELVEGLDFVRYLRGESGDEQSARLTPSEETLETLTGNAPPRCAVWRQEPEPGSDTIPLDFDRVREAMAQLVSGLSALHESGHLHRDVKPSNVLVTPEGRVVLLDFGIIAERREEWRAPSDEVVGTPPYMAPEQVTGEPTVASDWYSVGALLYQVLTGRSPFVGSVQHILRSKHSVEPPPPRLLRPDCPPELDLLCRELMAREPEQRPTGASVVKRLGVGQPPSARAPASAPSEASLVGRGEQYAALQEAFGRVSAGRAEIVYVRGESGVGKTALAQSFLDAVAEHEQVVVLRGRCYERESVPYKGVDSLIDTLSRYLMQLPADEANRLMPPDILLLAQLFPVLRRVEAVAAPVRRSLSSLDPRQVRMRGFAALRELSRRLSRRRPLVLFVDDLQWGDRDSALLLQALWRPPHPPRVLFIGSYREGEEERSPMLQTLLEERDSFASAAPVTTIDVGPLAPDGAHVLAAELLGDDPRAEIVARESNGHPYFLQELARYVRSGAVRDGEAVSLESVILRRLRELPGRARTLLRVVAVAARPLPLAVAQRAAGLQDGERTPLVRRLRAEHFARCDGFRDDDAIECYHDRIRETLAGEIDAAELPEIHRRLAIALQSSTAADDETVMEHFRAAGEDALAADYAVRAAEHAARALSFERAAELYRLALELGDHDDERRRSLELELADALLNAGHGAEAADIYIRAAEQVPGTESLELLRIAGEQLICSGRIHRGEVVLGDVLRQLGMKLPRTPGRAIVKLLARRMQLRLRGLRFRPRDPAEAPQRDLLRVDACLATAMGLSIVDVARGGAFSSHAAIAALRTGDRRRAARALALEAMFIVTGGPKAEPRFRQLARKMEEVAEGVDDPHVGATRIAMYAFKDVYVGRFRAGHEGLEQALAIIQTRCRGGFWEIGSMQHFSLVALVMRGEFGEIARLAPGRIAEAEARGDIFTSTNIRALSTPCIYMGRDQPEAARREAREAIAQWGQEGFHNQHYMALVIQVQVDLYERKGRQAYQRCIGNERALRKSLLLSAHIVRGTWYRARALAATAAAREGLEPKRLLQLASDDARRLEGENAPWCSALATLVRAGVANVRGDPDTAVVLLRRATGELEAAEMLLDAAAARYRLGRLLGGDEGSALVRGAAERTAALGLSARDAAHALVPGYTP